MAPHFAQQVRKWLIDWADSEGYNIYTDGLVVHTTLDARLQARPIRPCATTREPCKAIATTNWNKRDGWRTDNPLVQSLVRESAAYAALREKGQSRASRAAGAAARQGLDAATAPEQNTH